MSSSPVFETYTPPESTDLEKISYHSIEPPEDVDLAWENTLDHSKIAVRREPFVITYGHLVNRSTPVETTHDSPSDNLTSSLCLTIAMTPVIAFFTIQSCVADEKYQNKFWAAATTLLILIVGHFLFTVGQMIVTAQKSKKIKADSHHVDVTTFIADNFIDDPYQILNDTTLTAHKISLCIAAKVRTNSMVVIAASSAQEIIDGTKGFDFINNAVTSFPEVTSHKDFSTDEALRLGHLYIETGLALRLLQQKRYSNTALLDLAKVRLRTKVRARCSDLNDDILKRRRRAHVEQIKIANTLADQMINTAQLNMAEHDTTLINTDDLR